MFRPVPKDASFPDLEKQILDFWHSNGIFQKSLAMRAQGERYTFYDGPPFATGLPHYGHLLAGTLKDVVPRYWTMKGKYVARRFGWDCHGLPVENEMEKELGISGKRQLEEYGVDRFNEACRSIVLRYTQQWRKTVERMGRWVDFDNDYKTMDPDYMESIWWVFKQLWDKGLIYRGHRVQPYCPRCATTLSNFETNLGYRDRQDPSITVTFPVEGSNRVLLAWTTTPWTLPSNVALAVNPDIDYVEIEDEGVHYVLAKARLSAYYKKDNACRIVAGFKGREMLGWRYKPLYEFFKGRSGEFFQVVAADFVSTEDGTGIVHIAPAFGEADFDVGQSRQWPLVCPVDDEGKFTSEVEPWQGIPVKEADKDIQRDLKAKGRLVHQSTLVHSYPHCYRCDTPLIYRAQSTWFMKIEPVKAGMIRNNQTIHWVPEHLREGRFGNWLENARDWNLSRNRYWGNPIPIWNCGCGHTECVGSVDQLDRLMKGSLKETVKKLAATFRDDRNAGQLEKIQSGRVSIDLHKHFVDALEVSCPQCGGAMKRTPEVLDCWFESGSMPYAQIHYPFENKDAFVKGFPADFIAEGLDQTRGWFYTLTVLSSALFEKPAFKNVIVNGIILAEDGKKLSKRLRNYVPPEEILDRFGADALRLFLIDSPAVKAEDLKFSESGVKEMVRSVILPLWNAYSFFVTYANIDGWTPDQITESDNDLDRWIKYQLEFLIEAVEREMRQYHLYNVVPAVVSFVDDLTNWYIRRSRRRFWKSESDEDKRAAYSTLFAVLKEYCKVLAPFLPFLSEYIYRNLTSGLKNENESVHLCDYPVRVLSEEKRKADMSLWHRMNLARAVVEMGRSLREEHDIKTRQPLSELIVVCPNERTWIDIEAMRDLILEELNVKTVSRAQNERDFVSLKAKPNFRTLGRKMGKFMPEAKKSIEELSPDQIESLAGGRAIRIPQGEIGPEDVELVRIPREGIFVKTGTVPADNESLESSGEKSATAELAVALATQLTPELVSEGQAREFVHMVQNLRKQKGFEVSDRIRLRVETTDSLWESLSRNKIYIMNETLAAELQREKALSAEGQDINGETAKIALERN